MKLNIQDMQRNMRLKYDLIKLSAIITCRHYITLHICTSSTQLNVWK